MLGSKNCSFNRSSTEFGDSLGIRCGVPDLSLMGDLLSEMLAEYGEICSWKFMFEDSIWCRIMSKMLEATIVGFSSEELNYCIFLSTIFVCLFTTFQPIYLLHRRMNTKYQDILLTLFW